MLGRFPMFCEYDPVLPNVFLALQPEEKEYIFLQPE